MFSGNFDEMINIIYNIGCINDIDMTDDANEIFEDVKNYIIKGIDEINKDNEEKIIILKSRLQSLNNLILLYNNNETEDKEIYRRSMSCLNHLSIQNIENIYSSYKNMMINIDSYININITKIIDAPTDIKNEYINQILNNDIYDYGDLVKDKNYEYIDALNNFKILIESILKYNEKISILTQNRKNNILDLYKIGRLNFDNLVNTKKAFNNDIIFNSSISSVVLNTTISIYIIYNYITKFYKKYESIFNIF